LGVPRSKKCDEVLEGHFFFNPKAGDQFVESIGNVIIAQVFKHVPHTLLGDPRLRQLTRL
jgi:hypothetical protein